MTTQRQPPEAATPVRVEEKRPLFGSLAKRLNFILTLLFIVFAFLAYMSFNSYAQQKREQVDLVSTIYDVRQALARLPRPAEDQDKRLAAARAKLEATERLLPAAVESTRVVESILLLARDSSTTAIPLATEPWGEVVIQKRSFGMMALTVKARGDITNVVKLLQALEGSGFKTLTIDGLNVTRAKASEMPEGTEGVLVTATMDLSVYARSVPGK